MLAKLVMGITRVEYENAVLKVKWKIIIMTEPET